MHPTETIDRDSLRDDIPEFRPGDTVKVHVRVVEGNRERVQVFQGAVMRRQGGGVQETFTVRKVSFGVGVERTFPVHSPTIAKIEVTTLGDVRRAKLYYLRDRHGKAAKIKERRIPRGKAAAAAQELVDEDAVADDESLIDDESLVVNDESSVDDEVDMEVEVEMEAEADGADQAEEAAGDEGRVPVSEEDLERYESEIELGLVQEYRAVLPVFSYVIETERRFYLANDVSLKVRSDTTPACIELELRDAWVWDMYRPARFVPEVRVVTFRDVNIERLPEQEL